MESFWSSDVINYSLLIQYLLAYLQQCDSNSERSCERASERGTRQGIEKENWFVTNDISVKIDCFTFALSVVTKKLSFQLSCDEQPKSFSHGLWVGS